MNSASLGKRGKGNTTVIIDRKVPIATAELVKFLVGFMGFRHPNHPCQYELGTVVLMLVDAVRKDKELRERSKSGTDAVKKSSGFFLRQVFEDFAKLQEESARRKDLHAVLEFMEGGVIRDKNGLVEYLKELYRQYVPLPPLPREVMAFFIRFMGFQCEDEEAEKYSPDVVAQLYERMVTTRMEATVPPEGKSSADCDRIGVLNFVREGKILDREGLREYVRGIYEKHAPRLGL